jgi:feruloyl-CoA synthase
MNASAHVSTHVVAGPVAPIRKAALWDAAVTVDRRADGAIIVGSGSPTPDFPTRMTDRLVKWATEVPDRTYITEASRDGTRRGLTYAETLQLVRRIASGLLTRGLSADRPIMILSGNDIEHALLTLAAQYIGVPVSPISTAYSLVATDYDKIRYIFDVLTMSNSS